MRTLIRLLLLGSALWSNGAFANNRALVVGINLYPRILVDGASGQKNLHGPVADAHTFESLLVKDFGFNPADVKVLTDGEATHDGIVANIKSWLIDGTKPGEQAVFYFAGHGVSIAVTEDSGAKRLTSAIVPSDASGDIASENAQIKGLILGTDMKALLDQMADRKVLVFADSCQSGSVTRDLGEKPRPLPRGARTLTPFTPLEISARDITPDLSRQSKVSGRFIKVDNQNLVVWHAATLAQVTFDYPGREGGVFTQSFADGLHGKATIPGRDIVTASSLRDYVQKEASRLCKQIGPDCSAGLTPEVEAPPEYRGLVLAPLFKAKSTQDPDVPQAAANPVAPNPVAANPVAAKVDVAVKSAPVPVAGAPAKADAPAASPKQAAEALAFTADAVLTHSNDFGLKADILPGPSLPLNHQVRFRIVSSEQGHLILLDAGPDGHLTQLFPNPHSAEHNKDGRIRAGAPFTIPDASYGFAITAQTRGAGSLIAIVAEDAVDLKDIVPPSRGFGDVNSRLLAITAAKLQTPILSPKPNVPNRAARWAFVRVPYDVE